MGQQDSKAHSTGASFAATQLALCLICWRSADYFPQNRFVRPPPSAATRELAVHDDTRQAPNSMLLCPGCHVCLMHVVNFDVMVRASYTSDELHCIVTRRATGTENLDLSPLTLGHASFSSRKSVLNSPDSQQARTGLLRSRRARLLDRWTRNRPVGAEHAAIPQLRTQQRAAPSALIENLAGIGRHRLDRGGAAYRAGYGRSQDHRRPQAKIKPSTVRTAPSDRTPVIDAVTTGRPQAAPGAQLIAPRRRQSSKPPPLTRQTTAAASSKGR